MSPDVPVQVTCLGGGVAAGGAMERLLPGVNPQVFLQMFRILALVAAEPAALVIMNPSICTSTFISSCCCGGCCGPWRGAVGRVEGLLRVAGALVHPP